MKSIIQILGPTGVGKSNVALFLAQQFYGEIISADSMQVYKGFDIGTDKIPPHLMNNIPHHLIDILDDCSQFNSSMFLEHSFKISEDIISRGKLPIVCGGTALYLKTMIEGIFPENEEKRISRERLNRISERRGLHILWNKLQSIDPAYAEKIGPNDRIRIIRALEIFYNNGIPPSQIFQKTTTPFQDYRFIRIGLNMERELLYRRIEQRVDQMIEKGLLNETRKLMETHSPNCPPFKSLGYKEIVMFLENKISNWDETIMLIKQHSRNFAKRQLSWFRQEKGIHWFNPGQLTEIKSFIQIGLNG